MTTYAVGDSIAVGIGQTLGASQTFATSGFRIDQMAEHFRAVTEAAQSGDTVIVSAGYNRGISDAQATQLAEFIRPLVAKGADVRILGLREQGITDGDYAHLNTAGENGKNPAQERNDILRRVATESGAQFAENTIAVANSIEGNEIHGNYTQLRDAALAEQNRRQREGEARSGEGIMDSIMGFFQWIATKIGEIFNSIFGGNQEEGAETPPQGGEQPNQGNGQQPAQQPTTSITPDVAAQADAARPQTPVTQTPDDRGATPPASTGTAADVAAQADAARPQTPVTQTPDGTGTTPPSAAPQNNGQRGSSPGTTP